ncbi:AmmeMemoRadiSam system radical SAM enzyme [Methanosphaerula palustris]|nr:AmmeMemoRadiSam system radical SAM enzyme [Methanosphaerula palustris]
MHQALMYSRGVERTVDCSLCSHRCHIGLARQGICGVRVNAGGVLYAASYGRVSSEAIDPIEKKPLFHFLPGTLSYSLGSIGCNFHCQNCQNWAISRASLKSPLLRDLAPEVGVERALGAACSSVSWTYNEPTMWYEYTLDMGKLAHARGLGTVYVTNGYITEEALRELAPSLDAFRVDIKAFSDQFYRTVCGAKLQPVLDAAALARELGLHVETVTLVIPGENDSVEEMDGLITWVIEHLGADTPMHFTRFHPDYRMRDRGPTPVETLERIYERARALGLRYPYLGNVGDHQYQNTYCPACHALLIERNGYTVRVRGLDGHRCAACGEAIEYVSEIRHP